MAPTSPEGRSQRLEETEAPSPGAGDFRLVENEDPRPGPGTPPVKPFDSARWRELTRAALAGALTLLLAVALLMVVWAVVYHGYSTQDASDLLCVVLAPLVGLVGAATGFYYGGKH